MRRLTDVNVLLALVTNRSCQHEKVRRWWQALPPEETLFICRQVQMGFLRLLCSETVMGDQAQTLPKAWNMYAALLASGRFHFVLEPPRLDVTWAEISLPFGRSPKVVMDAYLAAFARCGGYCLVTLDQAFAQFAGLEIEDPMGVR